MRLALLLCSLLAGGCISGDYARIDAEMPPDESAVGRLVLGESSLSTCLAELGAPLQVAEFADGAVMAWGARRDVGWNVSASVPLSDSTTGSLRFSQERAGYKGVVLFFDEEMVLQRLKQGWLAEILPDRQVRPQTIED